MVWFSKSFMCFLSLLLLYTLFSVPKRHMYLMLNWTFTKYLKKRVSIMNQSGKDENGAKWFYRLLQVEVLWGRLIDIRLKKYERSLNLHKWCHESQLSNFNVQVPELVWWYHLGLEVLNFDILLALVQTGSDLLMHWHGMLTMCWCGMLGPHIKFMSTHSQHATLGPMLAVRTSVEIQVSKWGPRMTPWCNFRDRSWISLLKKCQAWPRSN